MVLHSQRKADTYFYFTCNFHTWHFLLQVLPDGTFSYVSHHVTC